MVESAAVNQMVYKDQLIHAPGATYGCSSKSQTCATQLLYGAYVHDTSDGGGGGGGEKWRAIFIYTCTQFFAAQLIHQCGVFTFII